LYGLADPKIVSGGQTGGGSGGTRLGFIAGKGLLEFVVQNEIKTLHVAGPWASKEPGVGDFVKEVLGTAFQPHREGESRINALKPSRVFDAESVYKAMRGCELTHSLAPRSQLV
jgi:hypothetical protein